MESLRTGRIKKVVKSKDYARASDIISTKGGFKLVMMDREPHLNTHKEPELRSAPPFSGIIWGLIGSLFLWAVGIGLVLWVIPSHAESIHVVHARGKLGATKREAKDIFAETQHIWRRDLGRELQIKSWQTRRNPFQRFHKRESLSHRATVLWMWQEYARRTRRHPSLIALVPPFEQFGIYYLAGAALLCGTAGYAVAEPQNQIGQDRRPHSAIAAAHEIGHIFGGEHDDKKPPNIMRSDALSYVDLGLEFSERSKKEIGECGR